MTAPTLFPSFVRPRRHPRVMMRITDAGEPGVTFQCPRCQRQTDWIDEITTTQAKRGLACPDCNPEQEPLPRGAVERSLTDAPRYAERIRP